MVVYLLPLLLSYMFSNDNYNYHVSCSISALLAFELFVIHVYISCVLLNHVCVQIISCRYCMNVPF